MNHLAASTQVTLSQQKQHAANTRLTGRWLILARVVWVVLVVFILGIFSVLLPVYLTQLQTVCTSNLCGSLQPTPDTVLALQRFGISIENYAMFTLVLTIASTFACLIVSGVIFWHKSDDRIALIAALTVVMVGTLYVTYTLQESHVSGQLLALVLNILSNAMLFLLFLLFPDGRFVPRWTRWLVVVWLVWSGVFLLVRDYPLSYLIHNVVWVGELICATIVIIYRFRYVSTPMQRQQTKWVVYGVSATFAVAIGLKLPMLLFPLLGQTGSIYVLVSAPTYVVDVLFFSVSIGFAILRSHLYDIDLIINRTLVYGSLTALLALVYFGLVIGLQSLVHLFPGQISQSPVIIVASTLAIAALFEPLRHGIQAIIDRRFYRRKYDAVKTVEAFSATLRSEVDLNQLHEQLLAVVQETMQPAHVSLWLRPHEHDGTQRGLWRVTPPVSSEGR